jgi:hypothetical protein
MSLVPLFNAITQQLLTQVGAKYPYAAPVDKTQQMAFIRMWNNQFAEWIKEKGQGIGAVQYPSILIEFSHNEFEQMGNGIQLYDALLVKLHIIDKQIDSPTPGDHEQNLYVYALADAVYAALQSFKPPGAINFVRVSHNPDFHHGNLYHFISTFKTNYIDNSQQKPVGGIIVTGGTINPDIQMTYDPSPFTKPLP